MTSGMNQVNRDSKSRILKKLDSFFKIVTKQFANILILIFCITYAINIFFVTELYSSEKKLKYYLRLERTRSDLENQKAYLNSSLYKEVFYKEQAYKVKNEIVLDTRDLEKQTPPPGGYNSYQEFVTNQSLNKRSNLESWLGCLTNKEGYDCF